MTNLVNNRFVRYGVRRIVDELHTLHQESPQINIGLSIALIYLKKSLFSTKQNPLFQIENIKFISIFITFALLFYALGFILFVTILSPIALLLLFLAPSVLLQVSVMFGENRSRIFRFEPN